MLDKGRLFGREIDEDEMMPMGTSLIDVVAEQFREQGRVNKKILRRKR